MRCFLQLLDRDVVLRLAYSGRDVFLQNRFWQVLRPDHICEAEDQRSLDRIFQLANIAWPIVVHQTADRFRRNFLRFHFALDRKLGNKIFRQRWNILAAFAQCGNDQGYHIQPIIKIFSKGSGFDCGGEILVGGRDQAYVY